MPDFCQMRLRRIFLFWCFCPERLKSRAQVKNRDYIRLGLGNALKAHSICHRKLAFFPSFPKKRASSFSEFIFVQFSLSRCSRFERFSFKMGEKYPTEFSIVWKRETVSVISLDPWPLLHFRSMGQIKPDETIEILPNLEFFSCAI